MIDFHLFVQLVLSDGQQLAPVLKILIVRLFTYFPQNFKPIKFDQE